MTHRAYVAERTLRDPRFEVERRAAAAELALGETLVRRRHDRNLSLAQLAETTGIAEDRLEAIEEGESLTIPEVLWLFHALDVSVGIDAEFNIVFIMSAEGQQVADTTKLSSATARSAKTATA